MVVGSSIFQVKLHSTVQELAPVYDPTSAESRRPCDPEKPSLHESWSMDMCNQPGFAGAHGQFIKWQVALDLFLLYTTSIIQQALFQADKLNGKQFFFRSAI